ncbi:hypothetical protein ODJ79_22275 [Actinoplanes sp. KI2]|uniref:hypothetical protein n=1 Tax=Actinoplanes sp. KI2 TaxID=2983315 RepID=UPI0021D5E3D7|nr:hypothetical protein [Actinoplanes sp. KI2]MCU7726467.1 hypothetical protein [Actinoplanes sp. KI2]
MVLRRIVLAAVLLMPAGCGVQRHGLVVPSAPATTPPAVSAAVSAAGPHTPTPAPSTIAGLVPSALVVSRSGAPPGQFDGVRLTDALLTLDDMPAGWTVGTSTVNQTGFEVTNCPPYDRINAWPGVQAVIGFQAGDGRTQLVEGVLATTDADAKRLLATTRQMIVQCLTITIHDSGGNPHVLDVTEPAQARLGDDSYTLRLGSGQVFYDNTLVIRRGGLVVTVASLTNGPDAPLLAKFGRDALAKAERKLR